MTVYIVQEMRGRDFRDAMNYGEIEVLVTHTEQVTLQVHSYAQRIMKRLTNFCDNDYLLLSGDPTAIAAAAAAAAYYNNGRFKVLKWDRQNEKYIPLQVDMTPEKG